MRLRAVPTVAQVLEPLLRSLASAGVAGLAFKLHVALVGGHYRGFFASAIANELLSEEQGSAVSVKVIGLPAFGDVDDHVVSVRLWLL